MSEEASGQGQSGDPEHRDDHPDRRLDDFERRRSPVPAPSAPPDDAPPAPSAPPEEVPQ